MVGLSVSVADHNLFQQMGIFGAWARFLNLRTPKLAFAHIPYNQNPTPKDHSGDSPRMPLEGRRPDTSDVNERDRMTELPQNNSVTSVSFDHPSARGSQQNSPDQKTNRP